jgi:hypothetical protein
VKFGRYPTNRIYIWQILSIYNIFQRIMDYLKPEVLITPATLQIQSPEKQKALL